MYCIQQLANAFRPHLEICGQSEDQISPAALDAQLERRCFPECPGKTESPNRVLSGAERGQLGWGSEAGVEYEEEVVGSAAFVEGGGERAVHVQEFVCSLNLWSHHRDQTGLGLG